MKKLIVLLTATVLAMSMALPVFAQEKEDEGKAKPAMHKSMHKMHRHHRHHKHRKHRKHHRHGHAMAHKKMSGGKMGSKMSGNPKAGGKMGSMKSGGKRM